MQSIQRNVIPQSNVISQPQVNPRGYDFVGLKLPIEEIFNTKTVDLREVADLEKNQSLEIQGKQQPIRIQYDEKFSLLQVFIPGSKIPVNIDLAEPKGIGIYLPNKDILQHLIDNEIFTQDVLTAPQFPEFIDPKNEEVPRKPALSNPQKKTIRPQENSTGKSNPHNPEFLYDFQIITKVKNTNPLTPTVLQNPTGEFDILDPCLTISRENSATRSFIDSQGGSPL